MTPRAQVILGWAIVALASVGLWLFLRGTWSVDLTAIYFAAHFIGQGDPDLVYLPGANIRVVDPPAAWAALAASQGNPDGKLTPYLYPPLWAALLAPVVERVSAQGFFDAVNALNIAALAGTIWLSFRLIGSSRIGFGTWAALSLALGVGSGFGFFGLWLGQPQIIVSFVTLLAFVLLAGRRDLGAGAVLALAAAMKLGPALLVVIFVMERRWRALAAFVVVGGALAAASVLMAGWPMHQAFLAKLAALDDSVMISRTSAGLEMMLYQIGAVIDGTAYWSVPLPVLEPEPVWIGWVMRLVLIAGAVAIWGMTRTLRKRPRIWARLFAMLLLAVVTNPLPWLHYLILPALMLPGLVVFLTPARTVTVALAVAAVLSLPLFLWMARVPALTFPQAGLHLAVALGLLALVFWLSRRPGPANRPLHPERSRL
ncbi:glycosyltransferase family 87 protein [Maritimibacter fusiformis]|uniref:glycosyltransferase family 87 protein n=1 Tax=Maritimibacter fusiformis TaxID=2603819 RepID=UPI0016520F65|nr:glycosyltransferase family 87 protein [Maritimibacter fusiformis]